jgi:hypothetical protein
MLAKRPHLGTMMPRWGRPPHHLNDERPQISLLDAKRKFRQNTNNARDGEIAVIIAPGQFL